MLNLAHGQPFRFRLHDLYAPQALLWVVCTLSLQTSSGWGADSSAPASEPARRYEQVRKFEQISKRLQKRLRQARLSQTSMVIKHLPSQTDIFRHEPLEPLIPASVLKLLTGAAALKTYGPAGQLTTETRFGGDIKDGKLMGNLYIRGGGDPMLVNEILWPWVADLRHVGLKQISGDIVVDLSRFSVSGKNRTRNSGTRVSTQAYDAGVSALGINFNTYAISIAPGTPGQPALVGLDPYPLSQVSIDNRTRTKTSGKGKILIKRTSSKARGEGKKDTLIATGSIASRDKLRKVYRSMGSETDGLKRYLRAFLENGGITVAGNVRFGPTPAQARSAPSMKSFPMRRLVRGLNHYSNNYLADVLFLNLAVERLGRQGVGYVDGQQALSAYLTEVLGRDFPGRIEDGSGLSTANRLSAQSVVDLLAHMYSDAAYFPDFLASLPASGWDGTLKRRLKGVQAKGLVRAKTGSLTAPVAVSSLAGYLLVPEHGYFAFAIIQNGKRNRSQPSLGQLRDLQDLLLKDILQSLR